MKRKITGGGRGKPGVVHALCLLAAAGTMLGGGITRAEDRVTIRGAYYREPSTRVIQPVVEISKDLPDGFDVDARYLVDTITSASAAAGTAVDSIFTEVRNEVGLRVGKNWERTRATLAYKYSAESDYWSHTFVGSLARRFWGDTATVAASGGVSLDAVGFRARTPPCLVGGSASCPLDVVFGGFAYTQVLSPVAIAQINLDSAYLSGFLGNPYRTAPGTGYEVLPDGRLRNAVSVRAAYYFPRAETGVQFQYRIYWDFDPGSGPNPWGISAHTFEGRVYRRLTRDLEVRLLYRQYFQNHAGLWCDVVSNPGCSAMDDLNLPYMTTDPKLGPLRTEYPEVKLSWDAEALRPYRFFRWFAAGAFEISYGRYYQNDSFGNAHVLQTGYSMPY
ncbi:MAG TPA: DUF3570 domain-containing protein [Polyangia bacterium]|nr:DUF3570 domain-containing protein [Polyangia bacterium]